MFINSRRVAVVFIFCFSFSKREHVSAFETEISKDLKLYISKIVSDEVKVYRDETKKLKEFIELQGKQIHALQRDKLTLTSALKNVERKLERRERNRQNRLQIDEHVKGQVKRGGFGTQVAFHAGIKAKVDHVLQDEIYIFDDVITNIGNAYNATSGKFVAPSAGTYFLSVTIGNQNGDDTSAAVVANGNHVAKVIVNEEQSTQTIVINLKRGDNVSLQNSIERDFSGNKFSSFSGFLLYENFPVDPVVG